MEYCIHLSDNIKEVDSWFRPWFCKWNGCTKTRATSHIPACSGLFLCSYTNISQQNSKINIFSVVL